MPQATNLVLKNAAAVDKTFELINPAAGDGGMADWALKEGTISSVFPRISAVSKKTSGGRNVSLKFYVPSSFTDTVTGLTNVGSRAEWNLTVALPSDFPENKKDDVLAFGVNMVANALIKSMLRDGLGAT